MPRPEELDATIYAQRLAHKEWLEKALRAGVTPSEQATELVWELLIAFGEAEESLADAEEDILKISYELAGLALADMPVRQALTIYRDFLTDALLDCCGLEPQCDYRDIVKFTNLLSNAFCEANSDHLKRTMRHRHAEYLTDELRLAKRIQMHLLPKAIPEIPGFDFAGRLIPAQEIGGDYWSVKHKKADNVITLKLADITGHGVAAATLVAAVKFISGGFYQGSESAAEVIRKTNRVLTIETPRDILVSMVYGWLHPASHDLTLVNAGHSPAFICKGGECVDIRPTGPVLGVTETAIYGETQVKLARNDIVFFGSDGITEAGTTERFGDDRLKNTVLSLAHLSADEIADGVVKAVTSYDGRQRDDISLLVVKVTSDPTDPS